MAFFVPRRVLQHRSGNENAQKRSPCRAPIAQPEHGYSCTCGCRVFSLAIEQIDYLKDRLMIDVFKKLHEKSDQK